MKRICNPAASPRCSCRLAASAQSYSAHAHRRRLKFPAPAITDGIGFAVITIDGTTVHYTVFAQNIGAPTLAHIHTGAAGTAGAVGGRLQRQHAGQRHGPAITQDARQRDQRQPGGLLRQRAQRRVSGRRDPRPARRAPTGEGARTSYMPVIGKVTGANRHELRHRPAHRQQRRRRPPT